MFSFNTFLKDNGFLLSNIFYKIKASCIRKFKDWSLMRVLQDEILFKLKFNTRWNEKLKIKNTLYLKRSCPGVTYCYNVNGPPLEGLEDSLML